MLYGMVAALDEAVGNVTRALEASGLLSTTMVMFTSDNGAPVYFGGSNWPLRGAKGTLWEGGVRVPAFVYSPLLKHDGFTSNALFHATDWFTTILSLAGVRDHQMPIYALDGVDQSGVLHAQVQSNRSTMVYNINEFTGASAIRQGDYKLIVGYPGTWDAQYYEENNTRNHMSGFNVSIMNVVNFFENADVRSQVLNALDRKSQVRLFNLAEDPSESADLAEAMPEVVRRLVTLLRSYDATLMPIKFAPRAENADPKQWNNVITPGWCAATNATSEPTTASETRTSRSFYAPCSAVSCQSVSCLTAWLFMAIVPRLIIAMRCQFDIHY